jgi:hypothetical protein
MSTISGWARKGKPDNALTMNEPFDRAIDEAAVREHFRFLDPTGGVHLIVTPGDSEKRKKDRKQQGQTRKVWDHRDGDMRIRGKQDRKQFLGTVDELLPIIQRATDFGDAVHAAVNKTDGSGKREEANIVEARFLVADFDAKHGQQLPQSWKLPPTRILETSPNSHHCYWGIEAEIGWDLRDQLAKNLSRILKCDPSVSDRARALRLPERGTRRVRRSWSTKSKVGPG